MKLKKSIRMFLADVEARNAPKTVTTYRDRLKSLVAAHGSEAADKLTEASVKEWLGSLTGRGGIGPAAPDTVRSSITAVTQWQKFATEAGHLKRPIFEKLPKPPGRKRERVPTEKEQAEILRRASRAFARIYRCLRLTGARPSELAGAQVEDYDPAIQVIVRKTHKTARKVGKPRKIGVGRKMRRIIQRCIAGRTSGSIFLNERGKPWTSQTLSHTFRRLRDDAGLSKEIVLYSMRHAAGTAICKKLGIHAASHALGHADVKTTMRYVHPDDRDLASYQDAI